MPLPNLDHALSAAMRTVDLAVLHVLRHQPTRITSKGDRDLVTNIDLAVEDLIRGLLFDWDPEIGFLGEERGAFGDQTTRWVLDPIDGTINFAHGSLLCAIALALIHEDLPVLGVTALPFLQRRCWAVHGGGAYRDGEPITVSTTATLEEAVIGMCSYGSGPNAAVRDPLCVHVDRHLTARAQGVRRLGSTALGLRAPSTPLSCSATAPGTPPPARSSRAKPVRSSSTLTAAHTPPVRAACWPQPRRSPTRYCR
jgi:myo-inositol-1(or 4)-monophosphatase